MKLISRNQVMAACGNGALKLFDITLEVSAATPYCRRLRTANDQGFPIKAWHEHRAEIMSVEWSNLQKDTFITSSWDQTVKIVRRLLSKLVSTANSSGR